MSDIDDYDDDYEEIDEEAPILIKSLFDDSVFTDYKELFKYEKETHGFDLVKIVQKYNLDMIGYIKLINFIRSNPNPALFSSVSFNSKALPWDSDEYYRTVIEDDPLLQFDVEEELNSVIDNDQNNNKASSDNLIKMYENKLKEANNKIAGLCNLVQDLRHYATEKFNSMANSDDSDSECDDSNYISSYSSYGIHLEMLQDKVRTEGYMNAILGNKDSFKDKVVLDVGCGTGILSLFAAKAGARLVIAVDMSDVIDEAIKIAEENGYSDKIIFLKGKVEEVKLPVEQVDIIISEWMGYFLLFESMLDSVIYARDKYLNKSTGFVLPNFMEMEIFGVSDSQFYESNVNYWSNVYGFSMNTMKKYVLQDAQVIDIKDESVATDLRVFKSIDCCKCSVADVSQFTSDFTLTVKNNTKLTGLGVSFKTYFNHQMLQNKVKFHTDPFHESTHWKQTYFQFEKPMNVKEDDRITGSIECSKNPNYNRSYLVKLNAFGSSFSFKVQ